MNAHPGSPTGSAGRDPGTPAAPRPAVAALFGAVCSAPGWAVRSTRMAGLLAVAGAGLGWAAAPGYRGRRGLRLLMVDLTWSAPNTLLGAVFWAVNVLRRNRWRADPAGDGVLLLERGVVPGYATTVGTVVAGASARIEPHERVHVRQARLLGPLWVPAAFVGYVVAAVLPVWWLTHDHRSRPIRSVRDYFVRGVYPHSWHEAWAYRVAGDPP